MFVKVFDSPISNNILLIYEYRVKIDVLFFTSQINIVEYIVINIILDSKKTSFICF